MRGETDLSHQHETSAQSELRTPEQREIQLDLATFRQWVISLPGDLAMERFESLLKEQLRDIPSDLDMADGNLYVDAERLRDLSMSLYSGLFEVVYPYLANHPEFAGRMFHAVDFNWGTAALAERNIVNQAVAATIEGRVLYRDLDDPQRREKIFIPYTEHLKSSKGNLFHADHHYPHYFLSVTPSTELALDFALHLHAEGDKEDLLGRLSRSFGMLNHTDADIMLAHFVMRHAADRDFLETHKDLLKGVVRFHDFSMAMPTAEENKRVSILMNILSALDAEVVAGHIRYADTFSHIRNAFEIVSRLDVTAFEMAIPGAIEQTGLRHKQKDLCRLFDSGSQGRRKVVDEVERMMTDAIRSRNGGRTVEATDPEDLRPGTVRRFGPLLVVYLRADDFSRGGVIVSHLAANHPNILKDVTAVVRVLPDLKVLRISSLFRPLKTGGYDFLPLKDEEMGLARFVKLRGYEYRGRQTAGGIIREGGFGKLPLALEVLRWAVDRAAERAGQQGLFSSLSDTDAGSRQRAWRALKKWRRTDVAIVKEMKFDRLDDPAIFTEFRFAAPGDYERTVSSIAINGVQLFFRIREDGHMFMDPMPGEKYLAAIYGPGYEKAPDGEGLMGYPDYFANEESIRKRSGDLADEIARRMPGAGLRVLEIGAGGGHVLAVGRDKFGWAVKAVERVPAFIEFIRSLNIPVVEGRFEDIDFGGETYQAVVLRDVLEHVADPARFVLRMAGMTEENGMAYVKVPVTSPKKGPDYGYLQHLHHFSKHSIKAILSRAGFEIEEHIVSSHPGRGRVPAMKHADIYARKRGQRWRGAK